MILRPECSDLSRLQTRLKSVVKSCQPIALPFLVKVDEHHVMSTVPGKCVDTGGRSLTASARRAKREQLESFKDFHVKFKAGIWP